MRVFNTANSAWISMISELHAEGALSSPRGFKIKEILNFSLCILNPSHKVISNPVRQMSMPYAIGELLWYLSGRNDLKTMSYYSKRMTNFSDDGETLNSAYGYRIFGNHPDIKFNQWEHVKKLLCEDSDSRQAIIHLHTPNNKQTNDEVCTLTLQFLIRDGKLDMITNMRSNDIVWGFTYDVFSFMSLQEMMATELGVQVGKYYHNAGSMHLYERDFEMAEKVHAMKDDFLLFEKYETPFSFFGLSIRSHAIRSLKANEQSLREDGTFSDLVEVVFDETIYRCTSILSMFSEYKINQKTWKQIIRYDKLYDMMFLNCYGGNHSESLLTIFEGPDGTGKSYNIKIRSAFAGVGTNVLHFDSPKPGFDPMIYVISSFMSGYNYYDRSFFSEIAYAWHFKRFPRIDSDEIKALVRIMARMDVIIRFIPVLTIAQANFVYDRLSVDDKNILSPEALLEISKHYEMAFTYFVGDRIKIERLPIGGM